jgi:hypothetical protein
MYGVLGGPSYYVPPWLRHLSQRQISAPPEFIVTPCQKLHSISEKRSSDPRMGRARWASAQLYVLFQPAGGGDKVSQSLLVIPNLVLPTT